MSNEDYEERLSAVIGNGPTKENIMAKETDFYDSIPYALVVAACVFIFTIFCVIKFDL